MINGVLNAPEHYSIDYETLHDRSDDDALIISHEKCRKTHSSVIILIFICDFCNIIFFYCEHRVFCDSNHHVFTFEK